MQNGVSVMTSVATASGSGEKVKYLNRKIKKTMN